MRVLACGAWDTGAGYPRTASLLAALRGAGVEVEECRQSLPGAGTQKQRLAARPLAWPAFAWRLWRQRHAFAASVRAAVQRYAPDAVVVPYPGHLVAPWVRRWFKGPIVLDLFLSAFDTAVGDRRLYRPGSLPARLLLRLDRRACRSADLVLLDTPEHAAAIARELRLPVELLSWVQVGDPAAPPQPTAYEPPHEGEALRVLFFGTGVPLHGLQYLIAAVAAAPKVHLTLVGGTAPLRAAALGALGRRVELGAEFEPRPQVDARLARCHVVAGVFGDGNKAQRVVPFKVVHGLAAGRPVVTADTPAVRRWLDPQREVALCPSADPRALAALLSDLAGDPVRLATLAAGARRAFERDFSAAALSERVRQILQQVAP